ncbi:hypothetical protein P3G55_06955 [Leptospira sp. 96542]|nr:hypothetical protein [Leptospira sp. 96542]
MVIRSLIPFLLCTVASISVFPQGLPFFSSYSFSDPKNSLFQVETSNNGGLAISIPFRFPAELELGYPTNSFKKTYDPIEGLQVFSPVIPFTTLTPFRNPEGRADFRPDKPGAALLSYQPNVAYVFYRRGFSFDMGLSFGMSLDQASLSYVDVAESKIRMKYRLNRNLFSFIKNSRWELFLQLSELHRFDSDPYNNRFGSAMRLQEPSKSGFIGRQIYVTPGISISNSNLSVEGMVRVPINAREANKTLDDLWTPEIQTNLGLKYLIPVTQSSN